MSSVDRVGKHSQMPPAAGTRLDSPTSTWGFRPRTSVRRRCSRAMTARAHLVECLLVEPRRAADCSRDPARTDLSHGFGQRCQLVIFGDGRREGPLAAQHLPPARNRDPARMLLTQIPRMRLIRRREGTDDRRRFGVDKGQGRDRRPGASRAAALSGKLHSKKIRPTLR